MEQSQQKTDPYKPVSCDFLDELESEATLNHTLRLKVETGDGQFEWHLGHIQDFFVRDHADYLKLRDGAEIRLDKILDWKTDHPLPH